MSDMQQEAGDMSDSVSRSYYNNHGDNLHQMMENKQA